MNLFKYWLLIFSFLLITVACKSPKKERVELMSERNSIHLQGVLIRLLDYPLTNLICPTDSNFFIFLKTTDEYRDSWVYLVTVKDSFVKVEYRLLPSFKKTGYDHYYADTMQFVYYESYQLNVERQLWDEFTQNNVFKI